MNYDLIDIAKDLERGIIPDTYPEIITKDLMISCNFRQDYTEKFGFSLVSKNWINILKDLVIKDSKCLEIMSGRGLFKSYQEIW